MTERLRESAAAAEDTSETPIAVVLGEAGCLAVLLLDAMAGAWPSRRAEGEEWS